MTLLHYILRTGFCSSLVDIISLLRVHFLGKIPAYCAAVIENLVDSLHNLYRPIQR